LGVLAWLGDRALRARLLHYASSDVAEVREGRGWRAVVTGVRSNDMNGVVSDASSIPRAEVDELVSWFRARHVPATWLTASPTAELTDVLLAVGATAERAGFWMGTALEESARWPDPEGVEIRRVRDEADLDRWLDVAAACGWVDDDVDRDARRRLNRPGIADWSVP
jgi:hypothetical protein